MRLSLGGTVLLLAACGSDEYFVDAGQGIDAHSIDGQIDPDAATEHAPVASAGDDQRAMVDNRITLHGSGTDVDGDTLTYAWTQTAGPTVTLDDATSATPSFRLRAAGTYAFSLTVNDGATDSASDPVALLVHDLNGGEAFTLSLEPDGELWSWGNGFDGELGNGLDVDNGTPRRVCDTDATDCAADPFTGAIAIANGRGHALALKGDGTVWSWGDGTSGQLGRGGFTNANTPQPVCASPASVDCATDQLSGVVAIAAGYLHSIALKADGTLWAWGYNGDGELGQGVEGGGYPYPVPVCAAGATPPCTVANANVLDDIVLVAAGGGGHTIAMSSTGALYAFGHNKSGQVGRGDTLRVQALPTQVCAPGEVAPCGAFLSGVVDFDAWSGHSLALDASGAMWGWGGNDEGELGQITSETCPSAATCATSPSRVCATNDSPCTAPLANVKAFAAGRRYSVAVLDDGTMRAWGDNTAGQLGDGHQTTSGQLTPVSLVCGPGQTPPCTTFFDDVVAVATGSFHTLAITADGAIYAWGDNGYGQLGDGTINETVQRRTPGPVLAH